MKTKIIRAMFLRPDHQFKMGGEMYQVSDSHPNDLGGFVIHASTLTEPWEDVTIIVGRRSKFKIYIQK